MKEHGIVGADLTQFVFTDIYLLYVISNEANTSHDKQ